MIYHCGHLGCDICGGRQCGGVAVEQIGKFKVCKFCVQKALTLAEHVSATFSTTIDLSKPCARLKETETAK